MAEVSKMELEGLPYPLYDFTSSGITHIRSGTSETNKFRVGDIIVKNFGLLKIQWDKELARLSACRCAATKMKCSGNYREILGKFVITFAV